MNTKTEDLCFRADLLRETIRRHNLSQRKVADAMNMSAKTFSQKMNGTSDWTLKEIQQLKRVLGSLDITTIFRF